MNAAQLLPAVRDLYSRLPETYHLEPRNKAYQAKAEEANQQ